MKKPVPLEDVPVDAEMVNSLKAFNSRGLPDMVTYKYEYMAANVHRFFRGTCHLFYDNIARMNDIPESPDTWICGDLHLENFGSYKGNNNLVYFDLNDFDESILAPASWELIRAVTSILVAFQALNIGMDKALNMTELFLKSYAATLKNGKALYIEPQTAKGIICTFLQTAAQRTQKGIIKKHTIHDGAKIDINKSRFFSLPKELKKELHTHITTWLEENHNGPHNYDVKDVVFRLAGTGSIGVKRYAFLLKSNNELGKRYLLLDMKQAMPSSLLPHITRPQPVFETEAERVIAIQQRMQNVSPALISATNFQKEAYIIQEMQPVKDSIDFMLIKNRYRDIYQVISDMGMLTASAQLRSSGRDGSATADELINFANGTGWQEKLLNIAIDCAATTGRDYALYHRAYKKGAFNEAK